MEIELEEIQYLRKKLGLTQKQLSEHSGVSQSLIAKVESGKIEPAYSKCKKIFHALEQIKTAKEYTAKELMKKDLVAAEENDDLGKIVKLMKKHDISQIPVVRNNMPIGLISESNIIDKIMEIKDPHKTADLKAKDVMAECPPVISPETKQANVIGLLKYFPVVLVAEKGHILGLITKADILELVQR